MQCLLCRSDGPESLADRYFRCRLCDLRFLDPIYRLNTADEKARYLLHNNDVSDHGYQRFVEPIRTAVAERIPQGASGLDFGAGSGPVLAKLLEQSGYGMTLYDPIFWPNLEALERTYDFVVSCEVVEHFFEPYTEFARLKALVCNGGLIAIMTLLYDSRNDFQDWYYRRDPTHVVFYSQKTFYWIASHFGFSSPIFIGERTVLLQT